MTGCNCAGGCSSCIALSRLCKCVCACARVCRGGVYHTADTSHVGCIFFVRLALHFDDSCTEWGQNGDDVYLQPLPVAHSSRFHFGSEFRDSTEILTGKVCKIELTTCLGCCRRSFSHSPPVELRKAGLWFPDAPIWHDGGCRV